MRPSLRLIQPALAVACAVVTIMSCDYGARPEATTAPTSVDTAVAHRTGIPRWDQSPYGISGLWYDPGSEPVGDAVVDSLAANGASGQWVRLSFSWNALQRAKPYWQDLWYPQGFIEPVTRLKRRGIKIFATLEGTPYWATKFYEKDPNWFRHPPDNYNDWKGFVQAVVDSFPQIDAWGIWNEPNDTGFFVVPEGKDAAFEYARLVAIAAPIVHAAGKPLVIGDVAWAPSTLGRGKTERDLRDWVARMVRYVTVTFGQSFEVLAVHHYGTPEDNAAVAEVSLPKMYAENPDLPWLQWEVWLTEFAGGMPYADESADADRDIEEQLTGVFARLRSPNNRNPQWRKAFYFNLVGANGGHRNLIGNWEDAIQQHDPGLLRFRRPFALYNQLSSSVTPAARAR